MVSAQSSCLPGGDRHAGWPRAGGGGPGLCAGDGRDGVATLPVIGAAESASKPAPVLELKIGGSSVWVWREATIDLVTAVVRALKDSR